MKSPCLEVLPPWEILDEPFASHWAKTLEEALSGVHPLRGVKVRTLGYDRLAGLYRLESHPFGYAMVDFPAPGEVLCGPHNPPFTLYRNEADLMEQLILPMHRSWRENLHEMIRKSGRFTVWLTPRSVGRNYDERARLPSHDRFLRPILKLSKEAVAYGVEPASEVGRAAAGILKADRGRHWILLDREVIAEHELFWNATGSRRGTILIRCFANDLLQSDVFTSTYRPNIVVNAGAAHTPSALRLARQFVEDGKSAVVCLPRNNGMQWADIFAPPQLAIELFEAAFERRVRE